MALMKQYTEEELSSIYEKLPEKLKEALFSTATSRNILNSCKRNDIPDEKIGDVAEVIGYVLLGLLPPEELEVSISQKTGIASEVSKDIVREITRFILFPLKDDLIELYSMTDRKERGTEIEKNIEETKVKKIEEVPVTDINDSYREPIE